MLAWLYFHTATYPYGSAAPIDYLSWDQRYDTPSGISQHFQQYLEARNPFSDRCGTKARPVRSNATVTESASSNDAARIRHPDTTGRPLAFLFTALNVMRPLVQPRWHPRPLCYAF